MSAHQAHVAAIASGKGGAGKTTLAVGLGTAAALAGRQVLAVEFDAGLRGMDLMLGLDRVVYDLGDLLEGRCSISSALLAAPGRPGFFVIAAPASLTGRMSLADIRLLINGLRPYFDLILLDMPAGLGFSVEAGLAAADSLLAVVTPDPVCVRSGGVLVGRFAAAGFSRHRLVINRVDSRQIRRQAIKDLDEVIDGVGSQLIGVVPEDGGVQLAAAAGMPVGCESGMVKVCGAIVRRMAGEYVPLLVC
ncbi:MAG: septum site-determining protein MinD [Oscillospiraceae bacterium]|jgi:septum site-determining protein MinD|nr:septum site-determining protein MinD [Oscillospiraceae bacterium]